MLASTLSNDPLPDKRFDFQFVNPPYGYEWSKDYDAVTTREPMQNNPSVRQVFGQRGLKTETLPPLLPSSFSLFTFQRGQLFSSTQIPVCLGFLAKNKHANSVVVNKLALANMNLALRGIEADFGPENADTFRRDLHPDLRADYVLANPPFNDSDWFRKDDRSQACCMARTAAELHTHALSHAQ